VPCILSITAAEISIVLVLLTGNLKQECKHCINLATFMIGNKLSKYCPHMINDNNGSYFWAVLNGVKHLLVKPKKCNEELAGFLFGIVS
jgi:hypothetical protein